MAERRGFERSVETRRNSERKRASRYFDVRFLEAKKQVFAKEEGIGFLS